MDEFRRDGLERAIREHLTEHGSRNWKLVRDRFSDLPHATFWRAVRGVRARGVTPAGNKEPSSELTAPREITLLFPAYCQPYQKLAEYEQLIRDAQDLIEQAKGPGGKIKRWQMHAKGVAIRESLVRNQAQVMGDLNDLVVNGGFWQIFQEVVLEVSPEVQSRLISRLRELDGSLKDRNHAPAKAAPAPKKAKTAHRPAKARAVPAPKNPKSVQAPAKTKDLGTKQDKPEKAAKNSRKPPESKDQLKLI